MFEITGNKGFKITFENGLTLSCQFGIGNHCDNKAKYDEQPFSCKNAEIAVWDENLNWVTKKFFIGLNDDVKGYLSADEVGELINKVRLYPEMDKY